jgi:hypothetical protein
VRIASSVNPPHCRREVEIVTAELGQHTVDGYETCVVVGNALHECDVPYRPYRRCSEFSTSLCNLIRHREQLIPMLIKKEVIVSKMRSAYMPVEVLGFEVNRKNVCQKPLERCFDFPPSPRGQIRLFGGTAAPAIAARMWIGGGWCRPAAA